VGMRLNGVGLEEEENCALGASERGGHAVLAEDVARSTALFLCRCVDGVPSVVGRLGSKVLSFGERAVAERRRDGWWWAWWSRSHRVGGSLHGWSGECARSVTG
jgi:hypothetical protein